MNKEEITRNSYGLTAEKYAAIVSRFMPTKEIEKFLQILPKQAKIIDIGCGPGRDAKIFSEKGVKVTGIDFSLEMLTIAKRDAPLGEFHHTAIDRMAFPNESFDGAWASASLLHIPKRKLSQVLANIHSFLKKEGAFYLSLKKGSGESLEKDFRYGNEEKFWSFFEEEEIKKHLEDARFKILELATERPENPYHTHPLIKIFCKKYEN